jgi:hypothetical protein
MSKPRTTPEYVETARKFSDLVPGLRKYRNRKRLNANEKRYITQAANAVRQAREGGSGFQRNLRPVSERQARNLERANNAAFVGKRNGVIVRAVQAPPGARGIERIDNQGRITFKRSGLTWRAVPVDFAQDSQDIIAEWARKVRRIARRNRRAEREGRLRFGFWTVKGFQATMADPEAFIQRLIDEVQKYKTTEDEADEDVFLGFVWSRNDA